MDGPFVSPVRPADGIGERTSGNLAWLSGKMILVSVFVWLSAANPTSAVDRQLRDTVYVLTAAGRCDKAWDILWPLVETGNSEAAALLMVDMVANFGPPIHFNSDDEAINFFGFLLVASIGFVVTEGDGEMFNFGTLRKEGLGGIWPANDGMPAVCVAVNPPESCIEYAFENSIVFDADEVGAFLEAGLRDGATVTCFERGW